jgi:hypothetical protein
MRTTTICLSSRMGSLETTSCSWAGCSASTIDWSRSWEWTDSGIAGWRCVGGIGVWGLDVWRKCVMEGVSAWLVALE